MKTSALDGTLRGSEYIDSSRGNRMRAFHLILSAVALALPCVASQATTTTYSSASAFAAEVASGAYTESFDGLDDPAPGPVTFSGSGYAYTAFAPSDIYLSGGFLGTSQIDEPLTISFTGHPVSAIGANFFAVNLSDDFQAVSITLTLSDGTVTTFLPSSPADSFRGFVSDVAIASLVVSGPGGSLYGGLDDMTVGSAVSAASGVPEPAGWSLMAFGSAMLLVARRRKA
jgi:hypothetical protein